MTEFTAYFLAAYFSFVGLFYGFRMARAKKQKQFMGEKGSSHWIGHFTFRVFRVAILLICILRIPFSQIDAYLGLFQSLMLPVIMLTGVGMLVIGFMVTVIGHMSLGENWSSGLNPDGPSSLVRKGIYQYSRNPMFIGVMTTQLGFFLALPSVFTLICLVIGVTAVFNQVKLEEHYLMQRFGESYRDYRNNVPRWFRISASNH